MKKLYLILGFILALPVVSAQVIPLPSMLDSTIRGLFGGVSDTVYLRLILFIGVFTIFYAVVNVLPFMQPKDGYSSKKTPKGISVTLALSLAAIATFTMDDTLVLAIFNVYSGLFGLILVFIPAFLLIFFSYTVLEGGTKAGHFIRFLLLGVVSALLMSRELLSQITVLNNIGAVEYIEFGGFIIFIFAIIELVKAFGAKGHKDPEPSDKNSMAEFGRGMANLFGSKGKDKNEKREEKQARIQQKEAEDAQKLREVSKDIASLEINESNDMARVKQLVKMLDDVQNHSSFKDNEARKQLMPGLENAVSALHNSSSQLRQDSKKKYHAEDYAISNTESLIDDLKSELEIIRNDKIIPDDQRAQLNQKLSKLLRKLQMKTSNFDIYKQTKLNIDKLLTELVKYSDKLKDTVKDLGKATKKKDQMGVDYQTNEYSSIIVTLKDIVSQLNTSIVTIRKNSGFLEFSKEIQDSLLEKQYLSAEFDSKRSSVLDETREILDIIDLNVSKEKDPIKRAEFLEKANSIFNNIKEKDLGSKYYKNIKEKLDNATAQDFNANTKVADS